MRHSLLFFVTVGLLGIQSSIKQVHAQSNGLQEIVASTGDAAPDGNGTLSTFNQVYLNDNGDVSFHAVLSGTAGGTADNAGIFLLPFGGSLAQVVREGAAAPDANGFFASFSNTGLNNAGQAFFQSSLSGTSGTNTDNSGLFRGTGSGITTLAREGNTVPNGNGEFGQFNTSTSAYSFNSTGRASFLNSLVNTSGGGADNDAIFTSVGGTPTQIVRDGDTAPNGIGNFSSFGTTTKINDSGQVAFLGNAGTTNGIYRAESPGNFTPLYVEGDTAPDGNGTLSFITGHMSMNNTGQVAFEAIMTGTANGSQDSEGIFRADGTTVRQIAREGQSANGDGIISTMFSTAVRINEPGQVAFTATLRDTSGGNTNDSGIYRSSTSGFSLTEIARKGQAISTGDGLMGSIAFANIALNDQGHVAFQSGLSSTTNNSGIFIGDGVELLTVAQEGQELNGSTIVSLSFTGGEQFQSGLNNLGQVAYRATLADGSSVVQKWTPDLHWRTTSSTSWDTSSNWTLGIAPDAPYKVFLDSDASTTVFGPNSDVNVAGLEIGGGHGIATLAMSGGTRISSNERVMIRDNGVLTGDGRIAGDVTNDGTIRANNVTFENKLTNRGVIRGTASTVNNRVTGDFINSSGGNIRVDHGEYLTLAGPILRNYGSVQVNGGDLEVQTNISNNRGTIEVLNGGVFRARGNAQMVNLDSTGLIAARDSTLRFESGLDNRGGMGFSFGTSDVFGDILNRATGVINISGNSNVTFYDDIVQNGTMIVGQVGSSTSTAVMFGDFSGPGGFIGGGDVYAFGDLRPGSSPGSVLMDGNLFLGANTTFEVEFAGIEVGEFDQLVVTGDLNLNGNLLVSMLDGYQLGRMQEYIIADVGGQLSGQLSGLSEGDLVGNYGGRDLYISYFGGDGNDIALFTIPEPSSSLAVVMAIGMLCLRRKNRQRNC